MYLDLIKKYVNNLKKSDIETYANKNDIKLDKNELELLYNTIKIRWKDIYTDGITVINEYKSKLKDSTYNKLIELYNNIKRYYN
ncbi:MAG: hypothetical protein II119_00250 [Bacilli bacterium]|jgi:hypothetical protein|nr:hypothetical protein [Bacilli bacterium]